MDRDSKQYSCSPAPHPTQPFPVVLSYPQHLREAVNWEDPVSCNSRRTGLPLLLLKRPLCHLAENMKKEIQRSLLLLSQPLELLKEKLKEFGSQALNKL